MTTDLKHRKQYRYFDVVSGLFITTLLISNLLSSAKIIDLHTAIGPVDLIFDAGTLIFPISYIFGDVLTEVYGYQQSRRVIWLGFMATIIMAVFVWLAGVLPGEAAWESYAGQSAYDSILGGISGLALASIIAYWIGEFSNSYVLAKMKILSEGRYVWARTIGSTLVGQALDTTIFFLLAGLLGVFPPEIIIALIITNYIFKVGIEILFTPLTMWIMKYLKKAEQEDYYDIGTDFNPFRIN